MASEAAELMRTSVLQDFERKLLGLEREQTGQWATKWPPVLKPEHVSTIVGLLELYVNDVSRGSNFREVDVIRTCGDLHEEMADWFFLNWNEIQPDRRMTRDQIILGMTSIVYASWMSAIAGSYRQDAFGGIGDKLKALAQFKAPTSIYR